MFLSLLSVSSGLSKLHCLNKLSVNWNQLSSLDASVLDQLPNLTFLSMENNCISSLHGIQRVRSLLELYIGSNQISTSRDIYYLKASRREIRTIGFRFPHHFPCVLSELICSSFFTGIDKPHYSGSLWESFSGETGKLSNLCGVPPTLLKSSGWHCGGMYLQRQPVKPSRYCSDDDIIISSVLDLLLFSIGGN